MESGNDRDSMLAASQESAFEDDEAFEFDLDMTRADTKVWLVKVSDAHTAVKAARMRS